LEISDLQKNNLALVKQILAKYKRLHVKEEVLGQSEPYVLVQAGEIQVFLYVDGEANLVRHQDGKKVLEKRFELPDFSSLEALNQDLLWAIEQLVKEC